MTTGQLFNIQVLVSGEKEADELFARILDSVPPAGAEFLEDLSRHFVGNWKYALLKARIYELDQEGYHDVVIEDGNICFSMFPSMEKSDFKRLHRLSDASQSLLLLFLKHYPEPLSYSRMLGCRDEWNEIYDSLYPKRPFEETVGRTLDKCIKDNTPLAVLENVSAGGLEVVWNTLT
ncbi:MAG: hypothetical protein ACI39U_02750 [Candidatus Cryptobacteroides sp.]